MALRMKIAKRMHPCKTCSFEKSIGKKYLSDCKVVKRVSDEVQAQPVAIVKAEPLLVQKETSFNVDALPIGVQTRTGQLDPIEKLERLGGGPKRRRLVKAEKVDVDGAASDVVKSLTSCMDTVKLLVANLPRDITQPDLFRLFGHYSSFQCTYVIHGEASDESLHKAVLIFNHEADAKQAMEHFNGLLLDGCDVALKVELISLTRSVHLIIQRSNVKSPTINRDEYFFVLFPSCVV
ncbi:uncharacterized protein LOC131667288 isoform X2 [Phymastichus coffea]|uniref:uncharacterized protein LOC131667288 isoform X2 n=1 Tax=Phymastichus coffea TaxID=108790 RepID=UPI00273BE78E|nr:uncharacterized protein LOC131667288 isoform X2 [Phymastichus coffea]XP_058796630.1 uncharacterized protein LOC131667288 isoform X2 [Phymastichus coffea]